MAGPKAEIEGVQNRAREEALHAIEQIPSKTNLPQLSIQDANKNIDALLRLSYSTISLAATNEADAKVKEAKTQSGLQQLQMGLSILENAAGSTKNADAAWLAERAGEYLEAGAYGKAYACLAFGNSLLLAPGTFEEESATAKIRQTASDAQGMGAKGLEELFSSGKAEQLISAYNVEMEAGVIDKSLLALMDSGPRIQKVFGKGEASFIFNEAALAQGLSRKAAELSREGKAGDAAIALAQSQLIMGGIADYVSALELRRQMHPPARAGKEEYSALMGQADKGIAELRAGLEKAGELDASGLNAESAGAIQKVFAENSYSISMASAQADFLRLESSIEGYKGTAGKRLQGTVDFASEKIREGLFDEARQAVSLGLIYKGTFEKSSYGGIASEEETLEGARRAAGIDSGGDNLLQGRIKLGRALDYIISNGESQKGGGYDVRADLRGSAIALASVKAGGMQMETSRESHEGVLAEAKKNGVEVDSSRAERELGEMSKLALKGDAWGVWKHGLEKTSLAIADERSGLYDTLGTTELAKQIAIKQKEVLSMNTETWNLANSLGANAKALRGAQTLEEDMKPKAQVIASNAQVVADSLRGHSWKLEELEVKTEEYKGKHLGESAEKSTPESGREGRKILEAQLEGIEKGKYLVAVGRGMDLISRDALSLMQITLTGGESLFAEQAQVRHMSFMNISRAMGSLESASYGIGGFDRYAQSPYALADARDWKRNSAEAYSKYKDAQAEVGHALAVQWSPTLQYGTGEEQRLAATEAYSKHKEDQFASTIGIESEKNAGSAAQRASAADSLLFASYTISSHPLEVQVSGESTSSNFHNAIESMRRISSGSNSMDVRASISETQSQIAYAQMNYSVGVGLEGLARFMGATLTGPLAMAFIGADMIHGASTEYLRTGKVPLGTIAMGAALGAGKLAGALNALEAASGVQRGLMLFHNTTFTVLTAEGTYAGGKMLYDGIENGDIAKAAAGAQTMFQTLPFLAQSAHPGAEFLRYDVGRAFGRGLDYLRSPAPEAIAGAFARPETPSVVVDLNAPGPEPVAAAPGRAGISPVPTEAQALHYAVENSFSGIEMSKGADGKIQSKYLLQDGAIQKTFSERQVGEIEQAIYYAEKIVRGEIVQMPPEIIRMAERVSVEPEFVRATEVIDALRKGGGAEYDPRTLSNFYEKSRRVQISLARAEFERADNPAQYEAEVASRNKIADALGEVQDAVKANKGSKMAIEFSFGEWRELGPGESIRVDIPAEGGGLRSERVRIESIGPAEYGGGQYIITYTVERTGSTGRVALDRNADAMDAHNALAARTLLNIRAFEKAGEEAKLPGGMEAEVPGTIPLAVPARPFNEVWGEVIPKVQAIGDKAGVVRFEPNEKPVFTLDINGEQVRVRLNEVRAIGGKGMYISVTPAAEAEGNIFVPARRGQDVSEILPTLKRKVGEALERERAAKPEGKLLEFEEPFKEKEAMKEAAPKPPETGVPKAVEDTLLSAVQMRTPEGKAAVGEPRLRELARRGWDEVYRGRVDETPLPEQEIKPYEIVKSQLNNRFNEVAEIAFQDAVAERAGAEQKPLRVLEAEGPAYERMRNLMGTILDANSARIEEGAKPGEILRPSQFVSDYRVYLQRGIGLPKGVAEAAERMGVKTEVLYDGKYVTEVKDASQFFAIGDVHGDPVVPISTLKGAGVIIDLRPDLPVTDKSLAFAERYKVNPEVAKGTQIIFTGDYVDRGANSVEAVEFVQWLGKAVEALGNGSQVHTLRGNHEALFLRAFEIVKGKTDAEMAQLVKDMSEYTKLEIFKYNNQEAFENNPEMMARHAELHKIMEREFETHGLGISSIGLASTFESMLNRYGSWSEAVKGVQAEGGMVAFMRGTKAAVILSGDNGRQLFTHGGPVTRTEMLDADGNVAHDANGKVVYGDVRTLGQLEGHYERMLGDVDNWWAYNMPPNDQAQLEKFMLGTYPRMKNGDYSGLYVSSKAKDTIMHNMKWSITNSEALPNIRAFSENMGITSITVGHRAGPNVRHMGDFETAGGGKVEVNCIDGAISDAYMGGYKDWSGGILYKNAWDGNFVVQGRRDAPGNIEQPTRMLPFGSPVKMENGYTDAWKAAGQAEAGRVPERPAPKPLKPQAAPVQEPVEQKPAGVGLTLGEMAARNAPAAEAPKTGMTLGEMAAQKSAPTAEAATGGKTLAEMAAEQAKKRAKER